MRFFIDLDGVLANLPKKISELTGKPVDTWDNSFWSYVVDSSTLFLDLEPYSDILSFVSKLQELDSENKVRILTAIPKPNKKVIDSTSQKRIWCEKYLPGIVYDFYIGPYAEDKHKHCQFSTDILIDDSLRNCQEWIDSGNGIAIIHKDFQSTLEQINKILSE